MHRGHDVRRESRFEEFAAALRYAKCASEQSLRRGGAEADHDFGFEQSDFGVEPWATGCDFGAVWFFVDAAFATRFPFEMFDGIGDVGFVAIDARLFERRVEQFPGGADERPPLAIFLIPGLFSDEKDSRLACAVAKNSLRRVFVEVAGLAILGTIPSVIDGFGDGEQWCGGTL